MNNRKQLETTSLNRLFVDDTLVNGGHHNYEIQVIRGNDLLKREDIAFQNGARTDKNAIHGVMDLDLLYILKDRTETFIATWGEDDYNRRTLNGIKAAIKALEDRAEDRRKRGVLGTYNK